MIDHKHRYIYIHIPKTGGSSIERSLINIHYPEITKPVAKWPSKLKTDFVVGKASNQHWPLNRFDHYQDYTRFCTARNPFSRLVSEYSYIKRGYNTSRAAQPGLSFTSFVKQDLIETLAHPYHSLPQTAFITTATKHIDFIIKFENIQQDFDTVCDKIGIARQQLPHLNKTDHKHYTEYYDDETREIVAQKYARDIEYFGYTFGE
jgi:hypothetical protein